MYCIIIIRICNHAMHLEMRVDTSLQSMFIYTLQWRQKNQLNKGGCFIYKHRTGYSHFATNNAIHFHISWFSFLFITSNMIMNIFAT